MLCLCGGAGFESQISQIKKYLEEPTPFFSEKPELYNDVTYCIVSVGFNDLVVQNKAIN